METTKTYIAYYRVSTEGQGARGLGIDAQRSSVVAFTRCTDCILDEFIEVESGKKDERPKLVEAIKKAKETNSRLVIAKLDRLSRNASFIFQLRDTGVDFVCADMPDANTLTIGIFATLAQHERELIGARTKAALAELKKQGKKLGTPGNLTKEAIKKGEKVRTQKARESQANRQATAYIVNAREKGKALKTITLELNELGYKTSRGNQFNPNTVRMLLHRAIQG